MPVEEPSSASKKVVIMTTPKHTAVVLSLVVIASLPLMAQAETPSEPWLVRVRAVELLSRNKDTTPLNLSINDRVIPELDISYFFTENIAAELVLTYPQRQRLSAGGTRIGSFKHLPPTLTLQYHFTDLGAFKPYVGVGLNYTHLSSVHFNPAVVSALHPDISRASFGAAFQIGLDYEVSKNVYLNLDVKRLNLSTNVTSFGTKVGEFKVDPVLIGLGVGYRF